MKVSVAGSGYVSMVIGACLAEMGNIVTHYLNGSALDPDNLPFHEPGLTNLISSNSSSRRLTYHNDSHVATQNAEVVYLALEHDANVDEKVLALTEAILPSLSDDAVVVNCSATSLGMTARLAELLDGQGSGASVVANPLFLREGVAIDNFMSPDRIILGVSDHGARTRMLELYRPFMRQHERVTVMSQLDAELTRFAASAMLASRISLMNEIAAVAEKIGADIESVRKGIGSDPRIGYSYLYPGVGYGGFCLPGDVAALSQSAAASGVEPVLLEAIARRNEQQQAWALDSLKETLGSLEGKKIAIWGLAFRPETSDVS
ncbi:MAG: nucleotide sugar dehydrogenase, partial [Thalassolituus sp.]